MKKPIIITVLVFFLGAGVAQAGMGDLLASLFKHHKGVEPVTNELYEEECGACHFPYQPGLLPARSWNRLMAPEALADHFGDNAELEDPLRRELLAFLTDAAADKSWYKRSIKVRRSLKGDEAPLRITEVPYIRRKHADIPDKDITGNDQVRSLSYCDNCHRRAARGIYDEDTVEIPGGK